jgi:tRNA A37 threonylcarbamoyladenosine dehydratase
MVPAHNYELRFGGLQRLFGSEAIARLRQAHVAIIGLGGVGSWAVEAMARSGIGALTLIDFDDICVSNVNRQLHALDGAFGKPKADVLAERVRAIHPECAIHARRAFFLRSNAAELLAPRYDYVLDAIDSPSKKCLLIAQCKELGIPIMTVGASAGRADPLAIRIMDLACTSHDRLLQEVRKKLRVRHGFPRLAEPFGVPCVCSIEPPIFPEPSPSTGAPPTTQPKSRLDCGSGFGTASFVTGTFGLVAAAHIVRSIAQKSALAD